MTDQRSQQVGVSRGSSGERFGVIALALIIVGAIAAYVLLNSRSSGDTTRDLLPYQTLVQSLPDADQRMYGVIRQGVLGAEAERIRTSAWPSVELLAANGIAPFAATDGGSAYTWSLLQQGSIINYFGQPKDGAAPSWLLEVQEPEPGMPPDMSPVDDEHHRLPDGTMLHIYVWMHRYGGQVPVGFVRQPQAAGWMSVYATPPNPVYYNRR